MQERRNFIANAHVFLALTHRHVIFFQMVDATLESFQ